MNDWIFWGSFVVVDGITKMSSIFSPLSPPPNPGPTPGLPGSPFIIAGEVRVIEGNHPSPTPPALEDICVNPYASRKEFNSWLCFSLSFPHMLHKAHERSRTDDIHSGGYYHICRWPAAAMPGKSSVRMPLAISQKSVLLLLESRNCE